MRVAKYTSFETLDVQTAQWLAEVRASVAPRPHLAVEPASCALLVIDLLNYFAHPTGRAFLPAAPAIVSRVGLLLNAWRSFGGTVAFTQHCHTGQGDLGMLGRFFSDFIRCGEPEASILNELSPNPGEAVFTKTTYDAFMGTELDSFLDAREMRQVLVVGVLTHMCCETTARSAFCRGYEVYVPADATASSNEERHLQSLKAMADSVAMVTSTAEVLGRCQ